MIRYHPLTVMITLVLLVFILLQVVNDADVSRYADPAVMMIVIAGYWGACIVMMALTGWRFWTILGAGILATMFGTGLFFFGLLLAHFEYAYNRELVLDVVRAFLAIGSPFMLVGFVTRAPSDGTTV